MDALEAIEALIAPEESVYLLGMDVLGRLHWQQRDGALRIHDPHPP